MSKLVLTNAAVSIAGTDVSSLVASVTLSSEVAEVDTTSMGSTSVTRTGGLTDNSISIDFHQDMSVLEPVVWPLIGGTAQIVVRPNGTGTASTANPSYTMTAAILSWSPVSGAVGELNTVSVTWPVTGAITRAVA